MFLLTHSQRRMYTVVIAVVLTGVVLTVGTSLYARSLPRDLKVDSRLTTDASPQPDKSDQPSPQPDKSDQPSPQPSEEWLPYWVWTIVPFASIILFLWLFWNWTPETETSESTRKGSTIRRRRRDATRSASIAQQLEQIERKKSEVSGYETETAAILKSLGLESRGL